MAQAGDELVHPVTGERVVFRRTAADTAGQLLELDDHWTRADHATVDHIHPDMQERWEVVQGRVRFRIGGAEWTARAGQVAVAPAGVAHRAWNLGGGPVQLRIRMTPALRWEEVVARMFAPGAAGGAAALLQEFPRELAAAPPASRLDARFGGWHFRERHRRLVRDAGPDAVMRALHGLRSGDLPLTGALMGLRALPTALRRGRRAPAATGPALLDAMLAMGFVALARADDEVVLGAVGHFWRLGEGLVPIADRHEFAAFHRPGYARAAMGFRVRADEQGTWLETETRIAATDQAARRAFARYWALVRAGSGIIRREMLAAAARAAADTPAA
jgi:mannose-6-phosphate isomerase-like protein (cupin superfamily)